MRERSLTRKDLLKFSKITDVPFQTIEKLNYIGALDIDAVTRKLIKYDYRSLVEKCGDEYSRIMMIRALAKEYKRANKYVMYYVDMVPHPKMHCIECGKKVDRAIYIENGGFCDKCFKK